MKKILTITIFIFALLPAFASAHQPRIVTSSSVEVVSPEVSKAYYATLKGAPNIYTISSSVPFDLYVNILVPDIKGQKKDVSVLIVKDGDNTKPIAKLDATPFEWKKFFEPFGRDTYWQGPEYRAKAESGVYTIKVSSTNNDSKYSLAIGETEAFDAKEGMNAISLIPILKRDFFNESPAGFILAPFGYGYILIIYLLAFIFGFVYRFFMKKYATQINKKLHKNIGKPDRFFRFIIGVMLLVSAITTLWNPFLIFVSGFCFFEAIFSWCGLYAIIGKNTCPIE